MQWIMSLLFPSLAMFCAEHLSEARGCASVQNMNYQIYRNTSYNIIPTYDLEFQLLTAIGKMLGHFQIFILSLILALPWLDYFAGGAKWMAHC